MSKMVAVDEKKRDRMVKKDVMEFPRNDDHGVTVAFYGREVYEGVPMTHFSPKSPLNVVFYLLYLHILIFSQNV